VHDPLAGVGAGLRPDQLRATISATVWLAAECVIPRVLGDLADRRRPLLAPTTRITGVNRGR
jgi:hypothetical protein